jgi:O-antigen/teichoic acid export membrane protein
VEDVESGHETVARNAFHLGLGQATTTALAIFFSAALGRSLGAGGFGVYFLIASFSAFAYALVDWGQQFFIVREVARQPERGGVLLGTALVLRTAGAALVTVPFGLVAWALGYDAATGWNCVIFIAVSLPFFLAQSYGLAFRARDLMGFDAWLSVANKSALLGLALAALALGAGLPGVSAAQALAGIFALVIATRFYRRVASDPLRYSPQIARELLVSGSALLTAAISTNIHPYLDAVILSKLAPADAVGWFGAAKNILGTIFAPAAILGAATFPRISRAAADRTQFTVEVRAALRPLLWLGALAAVGTYLFADDAIAIVYGRQHFGPSGIILKAYAPAFLLLFVNVLLGNALFALHRARAFSGVKVASVVVGTALDLALIPLFQQRMGNGGIGAVAAFGLSEIVVSAGLILLLRRAGVRLGLSVDMARALASAGLTLLLFQWMPPLPFLVGVPTCVIAFLLCSLGVGLVRRRDFRLFWALLLKERL